MYIIQVSYCETTWEAGFHDRYQSNGQQRHCDVRLLQVQGVVAANTFSLTLSGGSCTDLTELVCSIGVRDATLIAETIAATVNGNQATGTFTDTTNVLLSGPSTVGGVLVTASSFRITH